MIRHPVVQVLREHFPRDIALLIDAKVNEIYLSEWKTQIAAVNADYKIHISEMLTGHGTYEFDSLVWSNHGQTDNEDPASFDHDYSTRSFNHRSQEDILDFKRRRAGRPNILHHRLTHISHVPTQTITEIELPRNY